MSDTADLDALAARLEAGTIDRARYEWALREAIPLNHSVHVDESFRWPSRSEPVTDCEVCGRPGPSWCPRCEADEIKARYVTEAPR